jgi:hypothetical protein
VASGRIRAIGRIHQYSASVCQFAPKTSAASALTGIQTSTFSRSTPVNPSGATPTIVKGELPMTMSRPTMSSAPPNCRRQNPWLRTATWAPMGGVSSSGRKKRPAAGRTPSRVKKFPLTHERSISRASAPRPTVLVDRKIPAICSADVTPSLSAVTMG